MVMFMMNTELFVFVVVVVFNTVEHLKELFAHIYNE